MKATQSSNKLSNLKKDYSADEDELCLINTFESEKKNPSQDLREVRSDTKSKPRIDFSTPIEIFICELQKVKNENQDTMEYGGFLGLNHAPCPSSSLRFIGLFPLKPA